MAHHRSQKGAEQLGCAVVGVPLLHRLLRQPKPKGCSQPSPPATSTLAKHFSQQWPGSAAAGMPGRQHSSNGLTCSCWRQWSLYTARLAAAVTYCCCSSLLLLCVVNADAGCQCCCCYRRRCMMGPSWQVAKPCRGLGDSVAIPHYPYAKQPTTRSQLAGTADPSRLSRREEHPCAMKLHGRCGYGGGRPRPKR